MAVKDMKRDERGLLEEGQPIFQHNADDDNNNNTTNNKEKVERGECEACKRMMSDMRKSSIRLLYLELQKNAVQGFLLPNISELTQILAKTLKELFAECDECKQCGVGVDDVIERTLLPMNTLYSGSLQQRYKHKIVNRKAAEQPHILGETFDGGGDGGKCSKKTDMYPSSPFFASISRERSRKARTNQKETVTNEMEKKLGTNFSELITRATPQAPHNLFKSTTMKKGDGHGKVRVMLRVVENNNKEDSCLHVDSKKKQVTLREASNSENLPKLEKGARVYSFDHIFEKHSPPDVSSSVLVDLLHTVVNGNDACLLTYGYPNLGQTDLMVGSDETVKDIGIIPCAISWLYQLIDDRKQRTGARFSIRVSAVEVAGKSEKMTDLLGEQGGGSTHNITSPSIYLPRARASTIQLSDFTELRASSAQQCASFFDAAVNARTCSNSSATAGNENDDDGNLDGDDEGDDDEGSTMIFSLHVYQYMVDKVGTGEIHGGRSRLHLIDLSGCNRKKRSRDSSQGSWLPISALGNVIVSLANGTRHIPHRDSKLTTLLREVMGSLSVRINLIASVSSDPKHCFETLSALQVTARIHRSRRKKSRMSSASSSGGDSSCDERRKLRRRHKPVTPLFRTDTCQSDNIGEMEFTSTSATESCDTVIYRGPDGGPSSDRELTDFEHPPTSPLRVNTNDVNITSKKIKFILSKNENNVAPCKSEGNEKVEDEPIVVNMSSYSLLNSTLERKSKGLMKPTNKGAKVLASCPNSTEKSRETSTVICNKKTIEKNVGQSTEKSMKRSLKKSSRKVNNENSTERSMGKCREKGKDKRKSTEKCSEKLKEKCKEEHVQTKSTEKRTGKSTEGSTEESTDKCLQNESTCSRNKENNTCSSNNQKEKWVHTLPHPKPSRQTPRKCVSTNTSPCKENSNVTCSRLVRTCSLDTDDRPKTCCCHGNTLTRTSNHPNYCQGNYFPLDFKSNDTITSVSTVHNFERDLVTKIADRFALEDEFTTLQNEDTAIFKSDDFEGGDGKMSLNPTVLPFDNEDFFIDDDFDTVCAGLESVDDLDFFTPEPLSPTHLEESEQRRNDIIECNNCLGTCKCGNGRKFPTDNVDGTRCRYDSEEDTDEKTNNDLSRKYNTKRNSFGSCDSHLDVSPRNFHKHPPSEGVSSGYESMWCESNGTIHLTNDNSTEKGRELLDNKKDPFDKVIEEVEDECGEMAEEHILRFTRAEKYRAHIKKLIEERQDLKAELHQTLKKLVLNRVPLPRIDDHLQQMSLNYSSRDTTKVLNRENRIIEKKVKVCKSHLQLVACFDNPPYTAQKDSSITSPLSSPRKRQQHSKPVEKMRLFSPPLRRIIGKVTSV